MKKYFIEDNNGSFWCKNDGGYWSNEKHPEWSIQYKFQGILLWVLPLYLMMRIFIKDYTPKLKLIDSHNTVEVKKQ